MKARAQKYEPSSIYPRVESRDGIDVLLDQHGLSWRVYHCARDGRRTIAVDFSEAEFRVFANVDGNFFRYTLAADERRDATPALLLAQLKRGELFRPRKPDAVRRVREELEAAMDRGVRRP